MNVLWSLMRNSLWLDRLPESYLGSQAHDELGRLPIHLAAASGCRETCKMLLRARASPIVKARLHCHSIPNPQRQMSVCALSKPVCRLTETCSHSMNTS
eukprot:6385008-Amphidinium_carterae.1